MKIDLSNEEKIALMAIVITAMIILYQGWHLFWFLTDDAFIVFRYVSNSMLGFGYVWNPPPFRPVEGYTSFLWVVILDALWRATGIEPPRLANWVGLFFSAGTLLLVVSIALRLEWNARLKKYRLLFLAMILVGVLTNRTFLAWTSSGLETGMFNFLVLFWLVVAMYFLHDNWKWIFSISFLTLLIYLSRPDGILYFCATLFMIAPAMKIIVSKDGVKMWLASFPLLGTPFHLLWRHVAYGEWLPNTYYAKVTQGYRLLWLESGAKYLLSFVMEYSLWVWILLAVFRLIYSLRSLNLKSFYTIPSAVLPALTVIGHMLYYTIVVGGDYFEYRVYSYLIPLLFLSFVWMLNRLEFSSVVSFSTLALFVALSLPIPWAHWYKTHNLYSRDETLKMVAPVADVFRETAPSLPGFVVEYVAYYDSLQEWLINHYVGIRHQELKALWIRLDVLFPSREAGSSVDGEYPVIAQQAVGVIGWVLPHVNIIDLYGLNDYVIARNPELRPSLRMAHLRMPPPGYVDCFQPNVRVKSKQILVTARPRPLTAETIAFCERYYLDLELAPINNPP